MRKYTISLAVLLTSFIYSFVSAEAIAYETRAENLVPTRTTCSADRRIRQLEEQNVTSEAASANAILESQSFLPQHSNVSLVGLTQETQAFQYYMALLHKQSEIGDFVVGSLTPLAP